MAIQVLGALKELISGDGLIAKGLEFVNKRWPPNMSEADRAAAELVVEEALHRQKMDIQNAARQDEAQFNERTIKMEGTASDLKTIPYIGGLIIFMRGAFRPMFSYMTGYLDYLYFTGSTERVMDPETGLLVRVVSTWTNQQETLLLAINLLVLVFFFGERAMKNVMPLIIQLFAKK